MTRLTQEREQEIRNINEYTDLNYERPLVVVHELLAEIDALRAENESNLTYTKHLQTELGDSIEYQMKLKSERDDFKRKMDHEHIVAENAIRECVKLKVEKNEIKAELQLTEYGLAREKENQKLRERVRKLREALMDYASCDCKYPIINESCRNFACKALSKDDQMDGK